MLYAVSRADGGVDLQQLFPVAAIDAAGVRHRVTEAVENRLLLSRPGSENEPRPMPIILPLPLPLAHSADWAEDSVPGWKLEFRTPEEVVAKWLKEIQRDRVRALRKPLMEELDIEQKRALVRGDAAAVQELEVQLQALRDAPADPAIAKAKTIEELADAVSPALRAVL